MSLTPDLPTLEADSEDEPQLSSLSQQAYLRIRDMIITLKLAPGALVNEAALMQDLGLGRTPIREALQRLACEGLIVLRPRRGAFVASLSILDLQQIFEVRRVVEGYAAALAAERATQADIASMRAILAQLDQAEQLGDARAYIEIDRAFHRALARSAHNRFLESSLSRLYNLNLRLWYLALDKIGSMREAIEEHRRILEAIVARDSQLAQAVIQEHITSFQVRIKEIV